MLDVTIVLHKEYCALSVAG